MLVVPNNATAKKVLSVPGIIVYLEDKKKLYLARDEQLNALAEEKMVHVNQHQALAYIFVCIFPRRTRSSYYILFICTSRMTRIIPAYTK